MFLRILMVVAICMPVHAESLTIMAFNVENLFDNTLDEGKSDETYLPITQKSTQSHLAKCAKVKVKRWRDQCLYWDWSDAVVEAKLQSVAAAIRQVNDGKGPDIVALQEIENIHILERLRTEYLSELGYRRSVLLEGKDRRGIDVAFLSKFAVTDVQHHEIAFPKTAGGRVGDTRPILSASFELPNGTTIVGYSVHFPAPYHPTFMRESAYATLNSLVENLPVDQAVFAAGDFNTTSEEDGSKDMLNRWVRPFWEVAHDLCKECLGTSYYPPKDDWSFLDMVLWRPVTRWRMTSSYIANQTPEQITPQGTPKRFRLPQATGVSDHWPIVMTVEYK